MNCEAYVSSEAVSSDHRIVSVKIQLSLRRNKEETNKSVRYDDFSLANRDICNQCHQESKKKNLLKQAKKNN